MSLGLVTAFYIAAAILFILALGGLSDQEKAKRAIWYGIVGMALAVIATIFGGSGHYWLLAPMVIIGGVVGDRASSAGSGMPRRAVPGDEDIACASRVKR